MWVYNFLPERGEMPIISVSVLFPSSWMKMLKYQNYEFNIAMPELQIVN